MVILTTTQFRRPPPTHLMNAIKWFAALFVAALGGLLTSLAQAPSWPLVAITGAERPIDLGLLAWVSLVPMMVLVGSARSHKTAAARGYVFHAAWFFFGCHFVAAPHQLAWIISSFLYGFYGVILALVMWRLKRLAPGWVPLTWAAAWVGGDWVWSAIGVKFPWLMLGYTQLDADPIYMQTADLFGVWGSTFGIIAINALLARMVMDRLPSFREQARLINYELPAVELPAGSDPRPLTKVRRQVSINSWRAVWRHHRLNVIVAASVLLAAHVYGLVRLELVKATPGPVLALMQPNVPLAIGRGADREAVRDRILDIMKGIDEVENVTDTPVTRPSKRFESARDFYPFVRDQIWIKRTTSDPVELLVWPETVYFPWQYMENQQLDAMGETGWYSQDYNRAYMAIPGRNGWYQQLSCYEYEPGADYAGVPVDKWEETFRSRNCSHLVQPDGGVVDTYTKMELVPVGEYVPFYEYTDLFYNLTKDIAGVEPPNHLPGTEFTVFDLPKRGQRDEFYRYGVVICFETVFPDLCRRFAANGAKLLLVQSNDIWFVPSEELWQIWASARVRAIESRVGLVRCVNSGISGVVGPDGRFIDVFEVETSPGTMEAVGVPGALIGRVAMGPGTSLYVLVGDVLPILCLIVAGVLILASFFRKLRTPFEDGLSTAMPDVATAEPVTQPGTSGVAIPSDPKSGGIGMPFTDSPPDKA